MTDFGERRRVLPKTGQTISYRDGDDGYFQKGWLDGERFKDVGDGTVVDNATGLMWGKDADGPAGNAGAFHFWNFAIDYALGLDFAGHTDWRLPNVYEFLSLFEASPDEWLIWAIIENTGRKDFWTSTTMPSDITSAIGWDQRNERLLPFEKTGILYFFCCRDA